MIGFIKGQLVEVNADSILIDVATSANSGIGYEILASHGLIAELWGQEGKTFSFWIYTHVREDALQLYGFDSKAQKSLFLSLLKVNGIGPKLALGILSAANTAEIIQTIESGDAKKLSKFPRVGKKTAEQMILTLQGKLVRVEEVKMNFQGAQKQIAFALKNLGFKEAYVQEFVEQLPAEIKIEEGVRQGLQALSQSRGEL